MGACPSCGLETGAEFAFCPRCGARLTERSPAREQRKTVTVRFCDVTGSTALGESVDPEALRALLARYFDGKRSGDAVNVAARLEQAALTPKAVMPK
jgi:class 3 adenylate cyclase